MKSFGQRAWVLPQPVLIIGTYNSDGTPNAMNAAWGGQWDSKEIMISMGSHATTDNLARCSEFTVAFATKETMVAADFVGIVSAKDDPLKMQKTGWTAMKACNVDAPVFTDFPMTLECRILHKIDETADGYNIVAEIVNIPRGRALPGCRRQARCGEDAAHHLRTRAPWLRGAGRARRQCVCRWQETLNSKP